MDGKNDEPGFQHPAALNLLSSPFWTSPNKGQFAPSDNVTPFHRDDLTGTKSETGPSPSEILRIFPILPQLTELVESPSKSVGVIPPPHATASMQDQSYKDPMFADPKPPVALPHNRLFLSVH